MTKSVYQHKIMRELFLFLGCEMSWILGVHGQTNNGIQIGTGITVDTMQIGFATSCECPINGTKNEVSCPCLHLYQRCRNGQPGAETARDYEDYCCQNNNTIMYHDPSIAEYPQYWQAVSQLFFFSVWHTRRDPVTCLSHFRDPTPRFGKIVAVYHDVLDGDVLQMMI